MHLSAASKNMSECHKMEVISCVTTLKKFFLKGDELFLQEIILLQDGA